jgi:hypothetical protein
MNKRVKSGIMDFTSIAGVIYYPQMVPSLAAKKKNLGESTKFSEILLKDVIPQTPD